MFASDPGIEAHLEHPLGDLQVPNVGAPSPGCFFDVKSDNFPDDLGTSATSRVVNVGIVHKLWTFVRFKEPVVH